MDRPYSPLDERTVADTLVRELERRACGPLPPDDPFEGAGIYAVYYTGDFPLYKQLGDLNSSKCVLPIYVGKASPKGTRKGLIDLDAPVGSVLYSRLCEHADSIRATTDLRIQDFRCRFLVTSVMWLTLGEGMLIRKYQPLWNAVIDGFGLHDPGEKRYTGKVSEWDTLHSGRPWEKKMKSKRSRTDLEAAVIAHLDKVLGERRRSED